jgi:hypothetical protein
MKKIIAIAIVLLAVPGLPAGASAKPTGADKLGAARECRTERGTTDATREAFRAKYKNFGQCVSKLAREEAAERRIARTNAAKECKAERADPDFAAAHEGKTFAEFYGRNANGKNAYGKCVSSKAKAKRAEMDAEDLEEASEARNAAHQCDAERDDPAFAASHGGESFAEFYGTNRGDRNAFGKCVSSKTPS